MYDLILALCYDRRSIHAKGHAQTIRHHFLHGIKRVDHLPAATLVMIQDLDQHKMLGILRPLQDKRLLF